METNWNRLDSQNCFSRFSREEKMMESDIEFQYTVKLQSRSCERLGGGSPGSFETENGGDGSENSDVDWVGENT